jgi:hypothetical protein
MIEMEFHMENQILRADGEQRAERAPDLAKKLHKREQRLLEHLQEVQEAERRALDRFRRIEARLQRKRDRLERIKSRLLLVREQIADLQMPDPDLRPEQVEPRLAISEPASIADSRDIVPVEAEPELIPSPDYVPGNSTTPELEVGSPSDSPMDIVPITTSAEPASPSNSLQALSTKLDPEDDATPEVESSSDHEVESPDSHDQSPAATNSIVDLEPTNDSTVERRPTKPLQLEQETSPARETIPPDVSLAKEAWVAAESAVQKARNTAHGMAASISLLSQTGGLSNELMEELLRKQSEANKALIRSQIAAREAYERLVQAQQYAEQTASQPVEETPGTAGNQLQQDGGSPIEDNAADQTVRLRAVHLKAW